MMGPLQRRLLLDDFTTFDDEDVVKEMAPFRTEECYECRAVLTVHGCSSDTGVGVRVFRGEDGDSDAGDWEVALDRPELLTDKGEVTAVISDVGSWMKLELVIRRTIASEGLRLATVSLHVDGLRRVPATPEAAVSSTVPNDAGERGQAPSYGVKPKIAVVDRERQVRDVIVNCLIEAGMEARGAGTGESGLELVRNWSPDVLVQNCLLGSGMSGLDACRALRQDDDTVGVGILLYTDSMREELEQLAFEVGADEFFGFVCAPKARALTEIIQAILRRARPDRREPIDTEFLSLDPVRMDAHVDGTVLRFSPTEFDILRRLALAGGAPVSREELLDRCRWSRSEAVPRVDVLVLSIRRKLGAHASLIATVWGVGYALGQPPPAQDATSRTGH